MHRLIQTTGVLMILLTLGACSTQTVKSTTFTPAVIDTASIPEDQLLDVGITVFDPGLDDIDEEIAELTFADVRQAETYYTSYHLASALQTTGNWGVVRVIPSDATSPDVLVEGTMLQSDGETMRLNVKVSDATGRLWYSKEYEEIVSRYSYDPRLRRSEDAFQGLYNKIANDMLAWRKRNLSPQELVTIRTVSKIRFAQDFAPEVYAEYLEEDRNGRLTIKRLPAGNDPIMARIQSIRERDNLYVDTLQDYYGNFARQMASPYTEFRRLSYDEVMKLDRLQAESRRNMILGVAAIVGGLAATQSSNAAAPYATYAGIGGGAWLIKEAFSSREEAQMHVETLAELGNSLEAEIAPQTIELEERTITLSGNVQAQYEQWRELLADITDDWDADDLDA
ncbi:MAG: hypothetical protein WD601_05665, partial [Pseudohongiellaceae bacterium]